MATVKMWYRGVRFAKDFVVKYLNYIFVANQKGYLLFTDGTKEIKFSRTPQAIKRASWDARSIPVVLVGKASGGVPYISFSKDHLHTQSADLSEGHVTEYAMVGGNFDLNIGLSVYANTIEEKDNLVDIVGIYLAHPSTKDYFMNHYLVLPEGPRLAGESEIREPTTDHPVYGTEMSFRVQSRWQEFTDTERHTLNNVIADLEVELNLSV